MTLSVLAVAITALLCLGFSPTPAQAQPANSAVPAPVTQSLDSLPPEVLASPQRTTKALSNPARRGASKRVDLCSGSFKLCWADGVSRSGYVDNGCDYLGDSQDYETTYVGYTVADDGRWPATGDTYWGHVVVFYGPCTTNYLISYATPPPDTEFALDSSLEFNAGKTRCFTTFVDIDVRNRQEVGRRSYDVTGAYVDEAICTGPPTAGAYGAALASQQLVATNGCVICDPPDYTGTYMIWEVVFPLRSSKKLNGIASSNHKLRGATDSSSGNVLTPDTWVTVGQATLAVKGKRKKGNVQVTGAVGPPSSARNSLVASGEAARVQMRLTLLAKRGGRYKPAGAKNLLLSKAGTFVTSFKKPKGTKGCQVEATWNGNKMRKPVAC